MPPIHILNEPTQLMKDLSYGAGYAYDHDTADSFSGQNYSPELWSGNGSINSSNGALNGRLSNSWPCGLCWFC